jgi:diguanylate cyclase (GGDEF)-like protein
MFDLPTLVAVAISANGISGVLLIYAWVTNGRTPALALWSIGYFTASVGIALTFTPGQIGDVRSIEIADGLLVGSYGLIWMGARSFNNRSTHLALLLLVGPAAWLLVHQLEVSHFSDAARISFVSSILLCWLVLTGFEFWHSNRCLPSRWPLIVIFGVQAIVILSRLLWPGWLMDALTRPSPAIAVIAVFFFEFLFQTVFSAFLLAFLMKERREEHYRRAALVDALTGIWNRRGFLELASRRLNRAAIDKHSVALIAFDLDQFKLINDSYGHLAGDRMLCSFCNMVTESLRPGDLFGRVGGEEFACLLADVSAADVVTTAERLRCRFANMEVHSGSSLLRATVSLGVAMAAQTQPDLETLMSAADRALYRAKHLGRNRVELEKMVARDATVKPSDHHGASDKSNPEPTGA